jgi:hypothetical protein
MADDAKERVGRWHWHQHRPSIITMRCDALQCNRRPTTIQRRPAAAPGPCMAQTDDAGTVLAVTHSRPPYPLYYGSISMCASVAPGPCTQPCTVPAGQQRRHASTTLPYVLLFVGRVSRRRWPGAASTGGEDCIIACMPSTITTVLRRAVPVHWSWARGCYRYRSIWRPCCCCLHGCILLCRRPLHIVATCYSFLPTAMRG